MARYKDCSRDQSMLIPVNFSDQLIPGTIEFAIDDIVDNYIDLSIFNDQYKNDYLGAKAYPPSVLLKIILLAYSKGFNTSRRIEWLCKTNILFISLTGNLAPDHSTIASFVKSMDGEIKDVFTDILLRCAQLDLIGGEVLALDGCKISSNASKEFSGTLKELENKKNKLKKMCESMLSTHSFNDENEDISIRKREDKYNKKIKKIDDFLKSAEPRKGSRGRENKSNITDNESAKMMSSNGVVQGYNGLAMVDDKNQIIVTAEAFGQGAEGNLLPEIVEKTQETMKKIDNNWSVKNKEIIADTNYFSEENCKFLDGIEADGYIPDVQFRKRDPRFPDDYPHRKGINKNLFSNEMFKYDEEKNVYICPAGNELKYAGYHNNHGYKGRRYLIRDGSCEKCYKKSECLRKNSKTRSISIIDEQRDKTYSEIMIEKIDSLEGRKIYSKRMGIVEPVFGNIRYCKGLDRFTLRSKKKVNIQWLLYCCLHNIEKTLKATP